MAISTLLFSLKTTFFGTSIVLIPSRDRHGLCSQLSVRSHGERMKSITENVVWEKTEALIQEKYGKQIKFRSLNLFNAETLPYSKGDDLIIPLNTKSVHLGEVIINRGSLLSPVQKNEVTDLVHFLVEPHVYNTHLKFKQMNTSIASESDSFEDLSSPFLKIISSEVPTEKPKLVSHIIHLRSVSALQRKNVALKIHEIAENNLFVDLTEISSQLTTANDFKPFSETTIFVSDLKSLNHRELQLLADGVKSNPSKTLFIVGSQLQESDLAELGLDESLKNDLLAILFDIDRVPLKQQTNTDVLELLFFNLE